MNTSETTEDNEFKVFDGYVIRDVFIYPSVVGTVVIKQVSDNPGFDDEIIHIPTDAIESVIRSLRRAKKLA